MSGIDGNSAPEVEDMRIRRKAEAGGGLGFSRKHLLLIRMELRDGRGRTPEGRR